VAPLVNLVAVPVFSLVLLPAVLAAALAAVIAAVEAPLRAVAWVLGQGYELLEAVSARGWAAWSVPDQPLWVWALALTGALVLLAPRGLPARWVGMVMLAPLWLVSPPAPEPGAFRFWLLDVGQGLAAAVQTHGRWLVFDAGPGSPGGFDAGAAVIAPFLRSRGAGRIDALLVSHADTDHAGGLPGLLRGVQVGRVLSGEPAHIGFQGAEPCRAGSAWTWDGVRFEILHPRPPLPAAGNDRSCVLRVANRAGALLLTGDVGSGVERRLVAERGEALRSRVLVAGHHGSAGSTSDAWLAAVAPEYVLFSAGYRNRFGFPRPEVLQRVARAGALAVDTVHAGAVELYFPAAGPVVGPRGHRAAARRYWSHVP
jgi:competence protein ComEC